MEYLSNKIPALKWLTDLAGTTILKDGRPDFYASARESIITSPDGKAYQDFGLAGCGFNLLGYADPEVEAAVIKSAAVPFASGPLSDLLLELHSWAGDTVFTSNLTQAISLAVSQARAITGKQAIVLCGYRQNRDHHLPPELRADDPQGNIYRIAYNKEEEFVTAINQADGKIAAIIMEPISDKKPKPEFIFDVQAIAKDVKALLIVDESWSGFRMNCGGMHLCLGINPDIAVFSPAIANGYPLAALLAKDNMLKGPNELNIPTPSSVAMAAAYACLSKHRDLDVCFKLMEYGSMLQAGLEEAAKKASLKLKTAGIPPVTYFRFRGEKPDKRQIRFTQLMLEEGYLVFDRLMPCFTMEKKQIWEFTAAAEKVMTKMGQEAY